MVNTFRKKDLLIMCSDASRNAWKCRHSGFLLHILQNYTLQTLCGSPHNICNEEGILNGLPFNRSIEGGYGGVFGTFFVCGLGEESFCSLTPEQVKTYKQKFHHAEILIGARGNEVVTLRVEPREKNKPPKGHDRPTQPGRE